MLHVQFRYYAFIKFVCCQTVYYVYTQCLYVGSMFNWYMRLTRSPNSCRWRSQRCLSKEGARATQPLEQVMCAGNVCVTIALAVLNRYIRKEPVRFASVPDFSKINRFGSVRFGNFKFPGSTPFGLHFSDASWLGSVRFRVRFRPIPELNGSVRFGRFGSVRFLAPSCYTEWYVKLNNPWISSLWQGIFFQQVKGFLWNSSLWNYSKMPSSPVTWGRFAVFHDNLRVNLSHDK